MNENEILGKDGVSESVKRDRRTIYNKPVLVVINGDNIQTITGNENNIKVARDFVHDYIMRTFNGGDVINVQLMPIYDEYKVSLTSEISINIEKQ
ncbi:MAG: hypothetical protein EOM11_09720 [Erysipelotrichia bacterium]|nr:hypothetical protein [Erysipelotrichia bacterium]